jgi:hypothetical protein
MTHEVWQIRVQGHLGSQWKDWFEGMTITNDEQGDAILCGPLADQAALYGVLLKIRDLGLVLRAVTCLTEQHAAPTINRGRAP